MNVSELDLPGKVIDALREKGYGTLYPPQAEAIPLALSGRNLVVAVPTASGKSLIGYVAAMKSVLEDHQKVLYIVPLKALASEKKDDLEEFSHLGFKTAMSTGDLDSEETWLKDADIIVATSEKADSLLRHGTQWMKDVGLVIADEIHMIHEPDRGPTLEVALTKMILKNPALQIIALSATISNALELAEWLNAELVRSDWRPTKLKEGVYLDWEIRFDDGTSHAVSESKDEIWSLISDAIAGGGQCLVFVNARRSTESLAVKYSKEMKKLTDVLLSDQECAMLEGESESTAIGRKLALCVNNGIAFHHAGLTYKQRKCVEQAFKAGRIKCIVATPTLAAGVNIPARRVIVRDTKRFESNSGNTPIPVMEIKQMCGRAGRPRYDPYGEAILIAKSYDDYEHLMTDYVMCDSENIISKLGNEKVLRSHILGLIATEDVRSEDGIVEFLKRTFYGSQSQLYGIEGMVEDVVDFLEEEEMIERSGSLVPLPFGKRVSDLYIDPQSAVILKNAMNKITDETEVFPLIHAVTSTPDVLGMFPKKSDQERLEKLIDEFENKFLVPVPEDYYERELFMGDLKTADLIMAWISETDEDTITDMMGIGPGDIRSRVDSVDWLLYAFTEIALIFRPDVIGKLRPLLTRVRYGVSEELCDLVSLKGVGRARARILYDRGYTSKSDIAVLDQTALAHIPGIGNALAKSLKEQTGKVSHSYQPREDDIFPTEEEMMSDPIGEPIPEEEMKEMKKKESERKSKENEKKRKKNERETEKGRKTEEKKQSNIFDF